MRFLFCLLVVGIGACGTDCDTPSSEPSVTVPTTEIVVEYMPLNSES
jgi:hypothetical protein